MYLVIFHNDAERYEEYDMPIGVCLKLEDAKELADEFMTICFVEKVKGLTEENLLAQCLGDYSEDFLKAIYYKAEGEVALIYCEILPVEDGVLLGRSEPVAVVEFESLAVIEYGSNL